MKKRKAITCGTCDSSSGACHSALEGIHKQEVVVIGHGTTSRLGVVRSLSGMGLSISVIVLTYKKKNGKLETRRPFDCYSKYIDRVYYHYSKDGEGLISLLKNCCRDPEQKVILLPDSDFSAAVIDDHLAELEESFLLPNIHHTPGEIRKWMNKSLQKHAAKEVGLLVTDSVVVQLENERIHIPDSITYPCFTKALATIDGGKRLFRRCDNKEELSQHLKQIALTQGSGISVLVEDYKVIDSEYAVLGFSDGDKVCIPGVIRFLQNTKSHFGIAMTGEVLPADGFESLLSLFKKLVLKIGFVGVFDIDFFKSGSQFFFVEINFRFGGSGYAITKSGVNLNKMLVQHLRGDRVDNMDQRISTHSTFVNERMCNEDWCRGFITKQQYESMLNDADIRFVPVDDDPLPAEVFERRRRIMEYKRLINKVFRIR